MTDWLLANERLCVHPLMQLNGRRRRGGHLEGRERERKWSWRNHQSSECGMDDGDKEGQDWLPTSQEWINGWMNGNRHRNWIGMGTTTIAFVWSLLLLFSVSPWWRGYDGGEGDLSDGTKTKNFQLPSKNNPWILAEGWISWQTVLVSILWWWREWMWTVGWWSDDKSTSRFPQRREWMDNNEGMKKKTKDDWEGHFLVVFVCKTAAAKNSLQTGANAIDWGVRQASESANKQKATEKKIQQPEFLLTHPLLAWIFVEFPNWHFFSISR